MAILAPLNSFTRASLTREQLPAPGHEAELPDGIRIKPSITTRLRASGPSTIQIFTLPAEARQRLICPFCGNPVTAHDHYARQAFFDGVKVWAVLPVVQCTNRQCLGSDRRAEWTDHRDADGIPIPYRCRPTHAVLPEECAIWLQYSPEMVSLAVEIIDTIEQARERGVITEDIDIDRYCSQDPALRPRYERLQELCRSTVQFLRRALYTRLGERLRRYFTVISDEVKARVQSGANRLMTLHSNLPNGYRPAPAPVQGSLCKSIITRL